MEDNKLDVRGYSCPVPVQRTRITLRKLKQGKVEILVDAGASKDNCLRIIERQKWEILNVKELENGSFQISAEKN